MRLVKAGLGFCLLLLLLVWVGPSPRGSAEMEPHSRFPREGILAIFRDDYPFLAPEIGLDPVSVPPTRLECGVKSLPGGEENFRLRLKLLKRAKESIRIQTYIFTADELGKKVADKLKRKRKKGVDVRLIVDAYTKFSPEDRRMFADLELKGVAVLGFEPMYLLGVADSRILNVEDVNKRFHEKYWVIDEKFALVGGTNIANEYGRWGDDPDDMWRDQDLLLTGPVVQDITRAFDENYRWFLERRRSRLPSNRVSWYARLWWKLSRTAPPMLGKSFSGPGYPEIGLDAEGVPVRFLRQRPRKGEDYIYQAYLFLIRNAKKRLLIENAYFVPNRALLQSLMEAAARGVHVTIITNSDKTNDVEGMQPLTRHSYLPLIKAGAEIYEWQGDVPGHGSLHSKFMVVDGLVSVVGSFNLDPRSINLNSEDVVLVASERIAEKLEQEVMMLDMPVCKRISRKQAEKWRNPPDLAGKFKLMFSSTLEDWY